MRFTLLAVFMFFGLVAKSADGDTFIVQTIEGVDVTYEIISERNRTCQVGFTYKAERGIKTAVDKSTYGTITIPAIVNGYIVNSISDYAFNKCDQLTSVSLPKSIISIGKYAFAGCNSILSLILPNSVKHIGSGSFELCYNLKTLNIPDSLETIGKRCFYHCSSWTSITIPNSVKSIDEQAFDYCSKADTIISLIEVPFSITTWVFHSSQNHKLLMVPYGTKQLYQKCTGWRDYFDAIEEAPQRFDLNITSIGNGSVTFNETTFGSIAQSFNVEVGSSATITFTPDTGYRIASVKVNDTDVTANVKNNQYIISSVSANTIVEVIFEEIPPITNTLSVIASGNGKVVCPDNVEVRAETKTFQVEEETEFKCQVVPDEGFSYIISCTAAAAGGSWGGRGDNYMVKGIKKDTDLKVSFKVLSYSLSITASGNGSVSYSTSSIKNQTKSFNVEYGSSATASFNPENGYRIASVKVNGKDVTGNVTNMQYTIDNIKEDTNLEVTFEDIPIATYKLEIKSTGNGYALYNGNVVRSKTTLFTVNTNTATQINFVPDNGYRIASVKANNVDVTSAVYNSRYNISSNSGDMAIEVVFEEIPITTYTLSIKTTGNGSVSYDDTTWRNETKSFTVNEGAYAAIAISPESGHRLKSILVDNRDVTADVKNNLYTTSGINKNTTIEVEFEVIPVTTYKLNIKATGNGSAIMGGYTIRQEDREFPVNEGTNVTIVFSPDNGNSIQSVKVNGSDITEVTGSRYVIEAMTANTSVEVTFVEDVNALTVEGINYQVTSQASKNVKLMGGSIGQTLTVPATVTQNGTTWNVTEIDQNAVMNNSELAAIIWNPEVPFTATVSNPNLLLYVTAEQYAPEAIKNVVANGVARQISLVDAASGNGFCCPQIFTAQSISYTHRYGMETGVGASKGWETITLPFDVQEITHQTKGTIVPFANWKEGDNTKPFWLYELTGSGFVEASSIQAYKPYIISMPNNPKYNEEWQLNGEVTFKASSVTIGKSDDLAATSFQDRTFIPNLTDKPANEGFFALNVINDYSSNNSGMPEGSRFVLNMRQIHPFEAYMSTTSKSRHAIGIFDDMTTDIKKIKLKEEEEESLLFDLQGRKTYVPRKGVYIKNGKKYIKK